MHHRHGIQGALRDPSGTWQAIRRRLPRGRLDGDPPPQIALGVALARPERLVCCIDGDGALIMHMGSMAIIGSQRPRNFVHIVLNNGAHDSVGANRRREAQSISAALLAPAAIHRLRKSGHLAGVADALRRPVSSRLGPELLEVAVAKGARVRTWVARPKRHRRTRAGSCSSCGIDDLCRNRHLESERDDSILPVALKERRLAQQSIVGCGALAEVPRRLSRSFGRRVALFMGEHSYVLSGAAATLAPPLGAFQVVTISGFSENPRAGGRIAGRRGHSGRPDPT